MVERYGEIALNGFYHACGVGRVVGIEWAIMVLRGWVGIFVIGVRMMGYCIRYRLECFFPDRLIYFIIIAVLVRIAHDMVKNDMIAIMSWHEKAKQNLD